MNKWHISDGTKVSLGGNVEGKTAFADGLRRDVKDVEAGHPRSVQSLPPPGTERLNLDDAWHVDCWVRDEATRNGLITITGPEVVAPDEWNEPADDLTIY